MVAPNFPIATSCRFRHLGDGTHWTKGREQGEGCAKQARNRAFPIPHLETKVQRLVSLSICQICCRRPHHKSYTLPSRTQRMSNASTKSPQAEPHQGGLGRKLSDTIPMEAVQRIAKLPVVESSLNIATDMYSRVKVRY